MNGRILVVSYRKEINGIGVGWLNQQGYSVEWAKNYHTARQLIAASEPELLLIDLGSDEAESGIAFFAEIFAAYPTLVALFVTERDVPLKYLESLPAISYDLLQEPISLSNTARVLERALLVHRLKVENSHFHAPVQNPQTRNNPGIPAEIRAQKSELRLRALTQSISDAIIFIDHHNRVTFWNKGAERVFQYSEAEMLGQSVNRLIPGELVQRHQQATRRLFEGNCENSKNRVCQYDAVRKDGSQFPAEITISSWNEESGPVAGAIIRDISNRKQAEQKLLSSEKRYRTIFDESPIPLFEEDFSEVRAEIRRVCEDGCDYRAFFTAHPEYVLQCLAKTRFLNMNRNALETYGAASPEELSQNFERILGEDNFDYHLERLVAIAEGKTHYEREILNYKLNGEVMHMVLRWIVVSGYEDSYGKVMVSTLDITKRILAEKALLEYQNHLEDMVRQRTVQLTESEADLRKTTAESSDLYNNAPCGYHSLDENGIILRVNETEARWLGYTREELVGRDIAELFLPAAREGFRKGFEIFKQNGVIDNVEFELVRKDGSIMPAMANSRAVYDAQGKFVMDRTTLFDNTGQKQIEKILRESIQAAESANRAKSAFLANMSHEIRTPMNAILGFTQLLMRDTSLAAPQRQHLDTISRSGLHLLGLINDILEMSKIEAGKVILNPKTFDLHAWIHDIETMFRVRTEAKKLQFLVDIDEHLPQYITADEHKLSSIFVNLLGNAVKFTEEGGITWRIRAGIRQNGIFQLVSEVEDSGAGIAPEEIQHLFKVFEQTSVGMAAGGGTGLGLAISRKIAQLMGGDILVESEPGRGSIFRVEVELKAGTKAGVKISAPIRHISHLKERQKSLRILIADDNEENRILLTHTLRSVGFQTREAGNGKEAVDFASLWEPHLILMDIRMPVLNGYQAIEQIRATDLGKEIPIIAVTASAFRDEKQNILRSGANHYIRKPFKDHELFTAIEELLKVEYVYLEETVSAAARPETDPPTQPPDWRKQLPEGWAAQVQQAVDTANLDHLLQLIQKIEDQAPQAATLLRDYAQTYQYDLVLDFIGEK